MRIKTLAACTAAFIAMSSQAQTSTYIYCGLKDGSDWEWHFDNNDNYSIISGRWARITQANGRYFNVFRVSESDLQALALSCPAGYQPQPADAGTSHWEVFEVFRNDGSRYIIDSYRTYYTLGSSTVAANFQLRV
ncbi:hypothetical protein GCM10007938_08680 [Vibrio zhanjiangensis]|uniref:Secreted protein n=1 Tax=Vibrio zhanjiangensis TaxID=1046128 RepID=A0ABQ6EVI2_9VIBR|nr:hypothetical protein [Vibrio zhanjiangensis]GLT17091.1 hypothetical protein GCM10007938_08680 [Vibrio zhanjiangensis]